MTSNLAYALEHPAHPYRSLALVLESAFGQASEGKGHERHASGQPFTQQRMQTIAQGQGNAHGLIYQVCKKAQESQGLAHNAKVRELLGVIVYAAGAIIYAEAEELDKLDNPTADF